MTVDRGIVIVGSCNTGTMAQVAAEKLTADIASVQKLAEVVPVRLREPESMLLTGVESYPRLRMSRKEKRAAARNAIKLKQ